MKVRDPDGAAWRVRRRWLPWRRRVRDLPTDVPSGPSGDDPISAILGCLTLILLIPVLLLAILLTLEFLLLLLLLPFVLLLRVFFGHAWVVEVRRGWTLWWHEPSGDWSQSGRRMERIGELISAGRPPPPNVEQ